VVEIREYTNPQGRSHFKEWFEALDPAAAAKVVIALTRMAHGNLSNVKGAGAGVFEYRIDAGPGLRIYFGKDGNALVILLTGGTKRRQQNNIDTARQSWADYKYRKTLES